MNLNIKTTELNQIVNEIKSLPILKAKYNKSDDQIYFSFGKNIEVIRSYKYQGRTVYQSWMIGTIDNAGEHGTNNPVIIDTCEIINFLKGFASKEEKVLTGSIDVNKLTIENVEISLNVTTVLIMPHFYNNNYTGHIVMPADMLKTVFDTVANCNYRRVLEGVHITKRNGKLICEGSDAHRAAIKETDLAEITEKEMPLDIIIPKLAVNAILRKKQEKIAITYNRRHIKCGNIIAELIDDKYPNIPMIIPNNCNEKIEIELKELEKAIKNLRGKTNSLNDAIELCEQVINAKFGSEAIKTKTYRNWWNPVWLKREFIEEFIKSVKKLCGNHTIIFEKKSGSNCIKFSLADNNEFTGVLSRIIV